MPVDAVDDAEVAGVDRELEREIGRRAFVHLNLYDDGALVGVLQPGMTGAPRTWTAAERSALLALRPALAPLVRAALPARPGSHLIVG